MNKHFVVFAVFSFAFTFVQQRQVQRATVAFLNVENLWDTVPPADYIDDTKDMHNPAFHRSVRCIQLSTPKLQSSIRGEWSDQNLLNL